MKITALNGLALIIAALFTTVQFGPVTAFARPATNTNGSTNSTASRTKPQYHIRKLPRLTAPAHQKATQAKRKARKEARKAEKEAVNRQHFFGTVAKKNGHYVLTAGVLTFKLNDQAQAKKYAGKKVNVAGKLNPYNNKINVKNIQAESG